MFDKRRSEQGAVTVFLIVIFAAVFAFVAIFIDFARMSALQAKTEALAHAAARSVMSAYDKQLLEEYGLFAFGETDESYIMSKVLQDNFALAIRSDDLPIMGARLDSSSVELLSPLGTYSVFSQQIREEMKYKAPIDLTIEVINRFKPLSQVMKEASNTVDLLGKLHKLYDKREDKLDELLGKQRKAAATVSKYAKRLPRGNASYIPDSYLGGYIQLLSEAAAQYEDYVSKWEEDQERNVVLRIYTELLSNYRNYTMLAFSDLYQINEAAEKEHVRLLPEARALLEEVRQINEQMRQVIKESEARPAQNGYNAVSQGPSTGGSEAIAGDDEIAAIRSKSQSLLLPESLFTDLEAGIEKQESAFNDVHQQANSLMSLSSDVISASEDSVTFKMAVARASQTSDQYLRKYADSGNENALGQMEKLLQAYRSNDVERKETEKNAAAELKEASNLLQKIEELKNKLGEHQKQFDRLETYYNDNRSLNQNEAEEGRNRNDRIDDPYETGKRAMGNMDGLYDFLAGMLSSMTDHAYQTEYIVSYYDFFDVSTLDEMMKGSSDKLDTIVQQFAPERQQVEYILYGFHNPVGNVAAAYGEIFIMRLAIRTMEGLIKNAYKAEPLFILASALLHGVREAAKDMIMLCQKGSLQLSSFLKLDLTYRDHLRLFLLLHGGSEQRFSRMLGLIRFNTGINPDERPTYIKGEVTVALPLWFLPGVSKAIGDAGALNGRVEGSRYYAVKQAHYSY
ncbi:hypothetical protein [Paenibacillus fonticola]|uniref:hypothetical protein n=1 Tax=Paenibacillus fonticola TaxID=379896 RepID=UPI00037C80C8|nr:hypothetical protein [Paenibacillus fonticola]